MSAWGNRKSGEVFPMVRVSDCHASKKGYPHLSADHHSGRSGSFQVKKQSERYFLFFTVYTSGPWNSRFMGVCTVNSSFNNIFQDFMKREMLLLWSFQDIHPFEKIWIGSTQTFQERYKKNKQIEFVFLENQLRLHTLSSV